MLLYARLKEGDKMMIVFLDCNIFSFWLPVCCSIKCVMIQSFVSGSFFHCKLRTPIPYYVKCFVSAEEIVFWWIRDEFVWFCMIYDVMQINFSIKLMDRLIEM